VVGRGEARGGHVLSEVILTNKPYYEAFISKYMNSF
jgi:hypothetical protein